MSHTNLVSIAGVSYANQCGEWCKSLIVRDLQQHNTKEVRVGAGKRCIVLILMHIEGVAINLDHVPG